MARLTRIAAALVLLGAPATVRAQESEPGTAVMLMRIALPDTLAAAQTMGLGEIEMRMTYATDGKRVAIQTQFGDGMQAGGMALGEMLFHAIWDPATDSIQIGVTLPPELAAQMGGGIGFRLDFKMPDSLPLPPGFGDSLQAALDTMSFSARNLDRASTAGGVACEEWEMVTGADTVAVCVAPAPAAIATANRLFSKLPMLQSLGLTGLTERQRAQFGGRDLIPLRMTMSRPGGGVQMELASTTTGMPDRGFFTLPEGLQPFPMEMLGGLAGAAAAGSAGTPQEP